MGSSEFILHLRISKWKNTARHSEFDSESVIDRIYECALHRSWIKPASRQTRSGWRKSWDHM